LGLKGEGKERGEGSGKREGERRGDERGREGKEGKGRGTPLMSEVR